MPEGSGYTPTVATRTKTEAPFEIRQRVLERAAGRLTVESLATGVDRRALVEKLTREAKAICPEIIAEQIVSLAELQRLRAFVVGDPRHTETLDAIAATAIASDRFHNRDRKRFRDDAVPIERTRHLIEWLDRIVERRGDPINTAFVTKLVDESIRHHEGLLKHGRWHGTPTPNATPPRWRKAITEWQVGAWAGKGRALAQRDKAWALLSLLLKGTELPAAAKKLRIAMTAEK